MSNIRAEILRASISNLQSKVEGIMLEINILLSRPDDIQDLSEKMSDLITRLSIAENALNQANAFYIQTIGQQVKANLPKSEESIEEETNNTQQ